MLCSVLSLFGGAKLQKIFIRCSLWSLFFMLKIINNGNNIARIALPLQPIMKEVTISDATLKQAAGEGMDAFVGVFVAAVKAAIGGELTTETLGELNADQVTLLAWDTLHAEVMDGGFVQLIHNGYGPFIFKNPFAKAVKQLWGMRDLSKLVYDAHSLYERYHEQIERDCTDDEFMALFEQFPEFDDMDDEFVEREEEWTEQIARYIDEHIERFATIQS